MLGDAGAIAIARGLEENAIMETVRLESDQIGEKGALEFAARLAKNVTMKKLVLSIYRIKANNMDRSQPDPGVRDGRAGQAGAAHAQGCSEIGGTVLEVIIIDRIIICTFPADETNFACFSPRF